MIGIVGLREKLGRVWKMNRENSTAIQIMLRRLSCFYMKENIVQVYMCSGGGQEREGSI